MIWIIPAMVTVYLLLTIVVAIGLHRQSKFPVRKVDEWPSVSVVVVARNEQRDLPRCLESLARLDYPRNKLQIILVDDRSTDATRQLMDSFATAHTHAAALGVAEKYAHLTGKSKGLATGFASATGDWVFSTDADAAVPPGWIKATLAHTRDNTGLISGSCVVEGQDNFSQLDKAAGFYMQGINFAIAGLGGEPMPQGPNIAIRRDVYEAAGGLIKNPPIFTDDLMLFKMAKSQGYACHGVASPETVVAVTSVGSIPAMLAQHKRWALGGLYDAPKIVKLAVVLVGIYAWLGSLGGVFGWVINVGMWAGSVCVRTLAEAIVVNSFARSVGIRLGVRGHIFGELYGNLGLLILPVLAFTSREANWHGEGYTEKLSK